MLLYNAGKVLSCGTHAASCRLAKYRTKFKDVYDMPSLFYKWLQIMDIFCKVKGCFSTNT